MRIGILTFHWAANHGAILQTYATCYYLKNVLGVEKVEVIDYLPKRHEISLKNALKPHLPAVVFARIKTFIKERRLRPFRNKLPLSRRYCSNHELIASPPDVDILLAGSDQIWNPSYAMHGEGGPTPVYFLNFGRECCQKVALSVSFGCVQYPEEALRIIKPFLHDFDTISVRENTGKEILKCAGITDAIVTADPTAVLTSKHYFDLCSSVSFNQTEYTALCILRRQNKQTKKKINRLIRQYGNKVVNIERKSMEEWLAYIRDAKAVVTNSFHCVMMCLKLHVPFVVLSESGGLAGMNDRLYTLLERFDLTNRIVEKETPSSEYIFEWKKIDILMDEYSKSTKEYLANVILGHE